MSAYNIVGNIHPLVKVTDDRTTTASPGTGSERLSRPLLVLLRPHPDVRPPEHLCPRLALRPPTQDHRADRPEGRHSGAYPPGVPPGPRMGPRSGQPTAPAAGRL